MKTRFDEDFRKVFGTPPRFVAKDPLPRSVEELSRRLAESGCDLRSDRACRESLNALGVANNEIAWDQWLRIRTLASALREASARVENVGAVARGLACMMIVLAALLHAIPARAAAGLPAWMDDPVISPETGGLLFLAVCGFVGMMALLSNAFSAHDDREGA
jgi:hypothetical protein